MLYDKYKNRIFSLARLMALIKRYRILILSILSVIVAVTSALLGTSGTISVNGVPKTELVYGETVSFEADAFLSNVEYEYRLNGSNEWISGLPYEAGDFFVRATSKTAFGGKKHSKEYSVTINAKKIAFEIEEQTLTYGELPTIKVKSGNALIKNDIVTCNKFIYEGLGTDSVTVKPDLNAIKIERVGETGTVNANKCYDIDVEFQPITLTNRSVEITVTDAEKIYDDVEFTSNAYEIVDGEIVDGDNISLSFSGAITSVGEIENQAELVSLVNENDIDVSCYYDIIFNPGVLTVTKRPISINTAEQSKTYDGIALDYSGYSVNADTPIISGHDISFNTLTLLDVGVINVVEKAKYVIKKGDDDVTSNYDVSFGEDTYFSITKRPITITSGSDSQVYDSNAFKVESFIAEGLVDSEIVYPTYTGSQTVVGTSKNTFTVDIKKADGKPSYDNYEVTLVEGEITITKRPIRVQTKSITFVYNGDEQYDNSQYFETDLIKGEYEGVDYLSLVGGHELRTLTYTNVTNVSDTGALNALTFGVYLDNDSVTENYQILVEKGTLTVEKRQIYIKNTHDIYWIYDGEAHYDGETGTKPYDNYDLEVYGNYEYLVDGHLLKVNVKEESLNKVINVNDSYKTNNASFVVTYEDGVTINENYDITVNDYGYGYLIVVPRPIHATTHTLNWIYDGNSHYDNKEYDGSEFTYYEQYLLDYYYGIEFANADTDKSVTLIDDHFARVKEGSAYLVTDINEWVNEIELIVSNDNSSNYHFTYAYGTLTIVKRPIYVKTHSITWVYDGEVHGDYQAYTESEIELDLNWITENYPNYIFENYSAIVKAIADNQTFNVTPNVFIEDVGIKTNDIYIEIIADGYVNNNYNIKYATATVQVVPRPIKVTTHTLTWVYDGNSHYDSKEYSQTELIYDLDRYANENYVSANTTDSLVAGHSVLVNEYTATNVIDVKYLNDEIIGVTNVITLNVSNDNNSNYEFVYDYGTLTILPRPVSVKTHTLTWVYDGNLHYDGEEGVDAYNNGDELFYNADYYTDASIISENVYSALVYGQTVTVGVDTATKVLGVEEKINQITLLVSNENTLNYAFTYDNTATLTVLPRPIKVTTHTLTWIYDGNSHQDIYEYTNDDIEYLQDYYSGYEIANEDVVFKLVEGNKVVIANNVIPNTVTNVSDTGTLNVLEFSVENADGSINENYYITVNDSYGTLTVLPRPIKVTTHTLTWIYDGNSHQDNKEYTNDDIEYLQDYYSGYEIANEDVVFKLVEGNKVVIANNVTPNTVTNVSDTGTLNALEFSVENADGSINENYYITVNDNYGTLNVLPRPIKVTTHTLTWVYDGNSHYDGEYGIDLYNNDDELFYNANYYTDASIISNDISTALVKGHEVIVNERTFILNVSKEENAITLYVTNGDNNNYVFTYNNGELKVMPRPIYVKTHSITWVYDGNLHYDGEYGLINYNNGDELFYSTDYYTDANYISHDTETPLVNGQTVLVNEKTATKVKDVESVNNKISLIVSNENTLNYVFIYDNTATLTVVPRPITLNSTHSREWTYDGYYHYDDNDILYYDLEFYYDHTRYEGADYVSNNTNDSLVQGQTVVVNEKTATKIIFVSETGTNNVIDFIVSGDNTANYDIKILNYGTLTINYREISIKPIDVYKVYDGKILKNANNDWEYVYGEVAKTDTLTVKAEKEITNVKESGYYSITSHELTHNEYGDVSTNYIVSYVDGYQEVYARKIIVKAGSRVEVYDGTEYYLEELEENYPILSEETYPNKVTASAPAIVEGQTYTFTMTENSKNTKVGVVPNVIDTFVIKNGETIVYDKQGLDVYNYYVTYEKGTIEITPRPISVYTGSKTWIYDGKWHSYADGFNVENLANGDSVLEASKRFEKVKDVMFNGENEVIGTPNWVDFEIYNSNGENVTFCYERAEQRNYYGELKITPYEIEINTKDLTKVYDGTPLTLGEVIYTGGTPTFETDGYTITFRQVVNGETTPIIPPQMVVIKFAKLTDVNDYEVLNGVEEITVYDEYGDPSTDNYKITVNEGTLTVVPRPIKVNTHSITWYYNGEYNYDNKPYTTRDYWYDNEYYVDTVYDGASITSLVNGHQLIVNAISEKTTKIKYVEFDEFGSVIGVTNNVDFIIVDKYGEPIKQNNYVLTVESLGKLKLLKRIVDVEVYNGDFTYNGYDQYGTYDIYGVNDGYDIIVDGYEIILTSIKFVGSKQNVVTIKLSDESLLPNYQINYLNTATLTVSPLDVIIKPIDLPYRIYNGRYQNNESVLGAYEAIYNDAVANDVFNVTIERIEGKNVGYYYYYITSVNVTNDYAEEGVDYNKQYNIDYSLYGTLEIIQRDVIIDVPTKYWIYDANEHSSSEYRYIEGLVNDKEIVHTISLDSKLEQPSIVDVGEVYNTLKFAIYDENGENVVYNYNVVYTGGEYYGAGSLVVVQRPIHVQTKSLKWIYDGNSHYDNKTYYEYQDITYNENWLIENYNGITFENYSNVKPLAYGQSFETLPSTVITDADVVENIVDIVISSYDVTRNYNIDYGYGTLTVSPRPIKATTHTLSWVYDGNSHYDNEPYDGNEFTFDTSVYDGSYENYRQNTYIALINDYYVYLLDTTEIKNVGTKQNVVTFNISNDNNYVITSTTYGNLTVTKRSVTLTPENVYKVYDGNEHYASKILGDKLVLGHKVIGNIIGGGLKNVGEIETTVDIDSVVIYDENNEVVTNNYEMSAGYGNIFVYARQIIVTSNSKDKVYDGTALENDGYSVELVKGYNYGHGATATGNALVLSDYEYVEIIGSITRVGKVDNEISKFIIYDFAGNVVYDKNVSGNYNYAVKFEDGELKVTPLAITVETYDGEWYYNGKSHQNTELTYSQLAQGDVISEKEFAQITDVKDSGKDNSVIIKITHPTLGVVYEKGAVNNCYTVEFLCGKLVVKPREIKITSGSEVFEYDGTKHSVKTATETLITGNDGESDAIVIRDDGKGDKFTYDAWTSRDNHTENENGGYVLNKFDLKINGAKYDKNNKNNNYLITFDYGKIVVEKRNITIKTHDIVWVYDGTYHYDGDESLKNLSRFNKYGIKDIKVGSLVTGHSLKVDVENIGSQIKDVNYDANGNIIGVKNVVNFKILKNNADLTDNYKVSLEEGWLVVIPRSITVKASDKTDKYNGLSLYCHEVETTLTKTGYTYTNEDYLFYEVSAILDGRYVDAITNGDDETFTMTAESIITLPQDVLPISAKNEIDTFVIKNANGEVVYKRNGDGNYNYLVKFKTGTLTMEKRPIQVNTHNVDKVYNGESQYDDKVYDGSELTLEYGVWYDLVSGQKLKVDVNSPDTVKLTDVQYDEFGNVTGVENILKFIIVDDLGNDYSKYYNITLGELGVFTMHRRSINISNTHDREWVFDGKTHYDDGEYTNNDLTLNGEYYELVNGHELVVNAFSENTTKITFVQYDELGNVISVTNNVEFIVQEGSIDKSKNYFITYNDCNYGSLKVNPLYIDVKAGSSEKQYDGKELTNHNYSIYQAGTDNEIYFDSYKYKVEVTFDENSKIVDVGEVNNVITSFKIIDIASNLVVSDSEVNGNYSVVISDIISGTLIVKFNERYITVKPKNIEVEYNKNSSLTYNVTELEWTGLPVGYYVELTEGSYIDGSYRLDVPTKKSSTIIGDFVILTPNGEDVTDRFKGRKEIVEGIIWVYVPIEITTGNSEKVYDGTPLDGNPEYAITGGGLYGNDEVTVNPITDLTEVGSQPNAFRATFVNENGVEVNYYKVTPKPGTIEVTKRPIYYSIGSDEKVYDGKEFGFNGGIVIHEGVDVNSGLLQGHELKVLETIKVTLAGVHNNAITEFEVTYNGKAFTKNYQMVVIEGGQGKLTVHKLEIEIHTESAEKVYDGEPLTNENYEIIYLNKDKTELDVSIIENELGIKVIGTITEPGSVNNRYSKNYSSNYTVTDRLGTLTVFGNSSGLGGTELGDDEGSDITDEVLYNIISSKTGTVYLKHQSFGNYEALKGGNGYDWKEDIAYIGEYNASKELYNYLKAKGIPVNTISINKVLNSALTVAPYFDESGLVHGSLLSGTYSGNYIMADALLYNSYRGLSIDANYKQYVKDNYLQLPESTRKAMNDVINRYDLNADGDVVELISIIANIVQRKVEYDVKAVYKNVDVADYFFNGASKGKCVHYATAATALFRALGIPARYTVGMMTNVVEGVEMEVKGPYHAWVEVFIEDFGWVPVEVTGGGAGGAGGESESLGSITIKPDEIIFERNNENLYQINAKNFTIIDGNLSKLTLSSLIQQGYTYTSVIRVEKHTGDGNNNVTIVKNGGVYNLSIDGEFNGVTYAKTVIEEFVLINPDGKIVYNSKQDKTLNDIEVEMLENVVRITPPQIVIRVFSPITTYNGTEVSYGASDYAIVSCPENIKVTKFILNGKLSGYGKIDFYKDIDLSDNYLTVIDESTGKTLTINKDFFIKFEGSPMTVKQREITIITTSRTIKYDGKEHTGKYEDAKITFGELVAGHTLEVTYVNTITDVGEIENEAIFVIVDENGVDVTKNYLITTVFGKITVTR